MERSLSPPADRAFVVSPIVFGLALFAAAVGSALTVGGAAPTDRGIGAVDAAMGVVAARDRGLRRRRGLSTRLGHAERPLEKNIIVIIQR